nr:spermidine/putrescine ABC transporter ATP-binding protein [Bacillota bacterium]
MTGVRLEQLTKIYPSGVKAVDNLSVAVAPGEFLAILGPSGCGKTTTLRMVAGLETPTSGSIYFGSRRMNDVPPQRRGVGLVFQQHAVFPNMSVYENVAYGLRVRRVSEPELRRRVMEHLELVGLADLAHRMPAQLSGGQLQRVALARALVIQPSVLLLDEPLSSLDAKLRASIRAEIKKIQRQLGITTVYVTHDQEEALSLADRVGVMHRGVLEQVGPPEEVYRAPATRFVASFVGEGTLLEGSLVSAGNGLAVVQAGPLRLEVPRPPGAARLQPGPVWVCVRPEAVQLGAGAGNPVLEGVVQHLEFLGWSVRGELRVNGLEAPLLFLCPARAGASLAPGQRVGFSIDPASVAVGQDGGPGT